MRIPMFGQCVNQAKACEDHLGSRGIGQYCCMGGPGRLRTGGRYPNMELDNLQGSRAPVQLT